MNKCSSCKRNLYTSLQEFGNKDRVVCIKCFLRGLGTSRQHKTIDRSMTVRIKLPVESILHRKLVRPIGTHLNIFRYLD